MSRAVTFSQGRQWPDALLPPPSSRQDSLLAESNRSQRIGAWWCTHVGQAQDRQREGWRGDLQGWGPQHSVAALQPCVMPSTVTRLSPVLEGRAPFAQGWPFFIWAQVSATSSEALLTLLDPRCPHSLEGKPHAGRNHVPPTPGAAPVTKQVLNECVSTCLLDL